MPKLSHIIETAKRGRQTPSGHHRHVLEVNLSGRPSHVMTNAIAAFTSEAEDIFLTRMKIVGGGGDRKNLTVKVAPAIIHDWKAFKMAAFFRNPPIAAYFAKRYGISAVSMNSAGRAAPKQRLAKKPSGFHAS